MYVCLLSPGVEDLVTRNVSKLESSHSISVDSAPGTQFCVWVRASSKSGLGPDNEPSLVFTVGGMV